MSSSTLPTFPVRTSSTRAHARTHAHTCTRIHTYTHIHTHTHTHTHTQHTVTHTHTLSHAHTYYTNVCVYIYLYLSHTRTLMYINLYTRTYVRWRFRKGPVMCVCLEILCARAFASGWRYSSRTCLSICRKLQLSWKCPSCTVLGCCALPASHGCTVWRCPMHITWKHLGWTQRGQRKCWPVDGRGARTKGQAAVHIPTPPSIYLQNHIQGSRYHKYPSQLTWKGRAEHWRTKPRSSRWQKAASPQQQSTTCETSSAHASASFTRRRMSQTSSKSLAPAAPSVWGACLVCQDLMALWDIWGTWAW